MGCTCQIDVEVECDLSPVAHGVRITRARRERECNECGHPIPAGDDYEIAVARFTRFGHVDLDRMRFRTCKVCLELRDCIFCGGYYLGGIAESIQSEAEENPEFLDGLDKLLHQLSPAAGARLAEIVDHVLLYADEEDDDE